MATNPIHEVETIKENEDGVPSTPAPLAGHGPAEELQFKLFGFTSESSVRVNDDDLIRQVKDRMSPLEFGTVLACVLASSVTKRASQLAYRVKGRSMTAPDMIDQLGAAFEEFLACEKD